MSDLETLKNIAEVARRARQPGASTDPTFFDLKAEVFEAIAKDPGPFTTAADALKCAEAARARAQEIRVEQTCTLCLDGQHTRCAGPSCKCDECAGDERIDITEEGRAALARTEAEPPGAA